MTERYVSSSDARNILTEIKRDGDEYVINGTVLLGVNLTDLEMVVFWGYGS
jgi:alkylation response protein AidB-like acyl-CoA dehydrogenase